MHYSLQCGLKGMETVIPGTQTVDRHPMPGESSGIVFGCVESGTF